MNKNLSHAGPGGFPRIFWIANSVELLERAAYYGVFIVMTLYLSRILGFNDVQAAWLSGGFSAGLYFLPTFTGALADRIGFRHALLLAFALLSIGYLSLALFPLALEQHGLVAYGRKATFTGLQEADHDNDHDGYDGPTDIGFLQAGKRGLAAIRNRRGCRTGSNYCWKTIVTSRGATISWFPSR